MWLLQRGSPESKPLDKAGLESDEDQKVGAHADRARRAGPRIGGLRTALYCNSLLDRHDHDLAGQLAGAVDRRRQRLQRQPARPPGGHRELVAATWASSDFWARTLQNWQSEFLAVGSMAILSVYLRQRGSPESKPVGAPHDATGVEG